MVEIHGNKYMTVAERVQEAGDKFFGLNTEVLYQNPVVIKATVTTSKGTFTGISAANPNKPIEKMSPYEVAETSAVGRALGFAGYGVVDGIATADEMNKPKYVEDQDIEQSIRDFDPRPEPDALSSTCPIHEVVMTQGISKRTNAPYWSHDGQNGEGKCFGKGYLPPIK